MLEVKKKNIVILYKLGFNVGGEGEKYCDFYKLRFIMMYKLGKRKTL